MRISVRVPGSCGEIVQGVHAGRPFLLTCPIALYSTAVVTDEEKGTICLPPKAERAFQMVLRYFHCHAFPYQLYLDSDIPVGKGMASSSADVTAVIQATACACGAALTEKTVGSLAAAVDPVDGVFARGLALIRQQTGSILHQYQPVPELWLAVLDTGGSVDTQQFHQHFAGKLFWNTEKIWQSLDILKNGLTAKNLGTIATKSALANQHLLQKPQLELLISSSRHAGALGINAAHSGTVCGIFFSADLPREEVRRRALLIVKEVPSYTYLLTTPLISGGMEVVQEA